VNAQNVNNNKTRDLMDSEADETSVHKLKRMIRMIKKVKQDMQKTSQ
jgi:hypothetical protein